jgi:hypothetical protein
MTDPDHLDQMRIGQEFLLAPSSGSAEGEAYVRDMSQLGPNSLQARCTAGRKVRPANICALGISAQLARFRKCRRRVPLAPRSPQRPAPASVALARIAENPE